MQQISDFIENITDFINEHKKSLVAVLCVLLCFLTFSAVIIYFYQVHQQQLNKPKPKEPEPPLILSQPLLVPEGPMLPEGYIKSREPKRVWTQEETAQWFTVPDEKTVKDLEKANDSFISDVVGAAP
ncbi:MAG: hypothetical protein K6E51_04890 [Treponema sp.]|nr:hypothetical protein [Treponema sp.]